MSERFTKDQVWARERVWSAAVHGRPLTLTAAQAGQLWSTILMDARELCELRDFKGRAGEVALGDRERAVRQVGDDVEITVELDATEPSALLEFESDVSIRLVAKEGPGGGWPVVALHGRRGVVEEFVRNHWGDDTWTDVTS